MNAAGIVGGHLRRPGAVSFPSGSVEEREREREKKKKNSEIGVGSKRDKQRGQRPVAARGKARRNRNSVKRKKNERLSSVTSLALKMVGTCWIFDCLFHRRAPSVGHHFHFITHVELAADHALFLVSTFCVSVCVCVCSFFSLFCFNRFSVMIIIFFPDCES